MTYFETPVLEIGSDHRGVFRSDDFGWFCCEPGLDAWFKGLRKPGLKLVICFSTTSVRGAVASRVQLGISEALKEVFHAHYVRAGDHIWWWVEIVT